MQQRWSASRLARARAGVLLALGVLLPWMGRASPTEQLAPDPPAYAAARARLEEQLGRAEAVGAALARLHNRLGERQARGGAGPCADAEGLSLVARARVFGRAHRDAVQAARAQTARVQRMAEAPTLAPLLSEADRKGLAALVARAAQQVRAYGELSAWHARYVPPESRCPAPLVPAAGLPGAGPVQGEQPVAVAGVGGGRLCPGALPADGRVVVLPTPRACYGDAACTCRPAEVLPGAVLGP